MVSPSSILSGMTIPLYAGPNFMKSLDWKLLILRHRIFDNIKFFRLSDLARIILQKLTGRLSALLE